MALRRADARARVRAPVCSAADEAASVAKGAKGEKKRPRWGKDGAGGASNEANFQEALRQSNKKARHYVLADFVSEERASSMKRCAAECRQKLFLRVRRPRGWSRGVCVCACADRGAMRACRAPPRAAARCRRAPTSVACAWG